MFIHQQWARRNTIFLFHEESNWIFDRFGDVWRYPHFSTPNYKIHEITMDFCHVVSSPISDFTWTAEAAPESAGMGVQPFLWRVPTSPCLRTPGRSTKLGLSARSSSSRWMQIQLSYAIF